MSAGNYRAAAANNSNYHNNNSAASDDEDELCPICIEPLTEKGETKNFLPCPCNYRVCMFCVRRLSTEFDNRCPGCRRDYDETKFRFEDKPPEKPKKTRNQRYKEQQQQQQQQQQ